MQKLLPLLPPPPQKKIWEVKQGYKNANEAVKKGS